ncbi:dITP/XTP pyrophosphatase [Calidithermus roseus]|uniref:dITP/XTP pyrophosphatase n=2 Tax=Calidithermus roseus TaxID=1644118 RepID=A0A399EYX0_9DEIN|nr:dITP/XTP pyrophosphatase [Calidithermus roseus]
MRVLVATHKEPKLAKLRELLAPLGWQLEPIGNYAGLLPNPDAPGEDLTERVPVVATHLAKLSGLPTLLDESCFEYTRAGQRVFFSLQFGPGDSEEERRAKLLQKLRGLPPQERMTRFMTVLTLAYPQGKTETYVGETQGVLLHKPKGEGGVGYDTLFFVLEAGKTLAEMSPAERERFSPWERAVRRLLGHHIIDHLHPTVELPPQGSSATLELAPGAARPSSRPSPMRLLVATNNPGKYRELREGLAPLGWELASLLDYTFKMPPEEGATFEDNAMLKAAFACRQTGLLTLADDSGLEVDALEGEPGVYSARFGGRKSDLERNIYLLERLKGVPADKRTARFVAVLAVAHPQGFMQLFRGVTEGLILEAPRGENGFGYDPLFFVPEAGKTFAEMSMEEKARHSHRGKALAELIEAYKDGFRIPEASSSE